MVKQPRMKNVNVKYGTEPLDIDMATEMLFEFANEFNEAAGNYMECMINNYEYDRFEFSLSVIDNAWLFKDFLEAFFSHLFGAVSKYAPYIKSVAPWSKPDLIFTPLDKPDYEFMLRFVNSVFPKFTIGQKINALSGQKFTLVIIGGDGKEIFIIFEFFA